MYIATRQTVVILSAHQVLMYTVGLVASYRKLHATNIERLTPVQGLLNLVIVCLVPLVHASLRSNTDDINYVHCRDVSAPTLVTCPAAQ
jgi:hypothetical protein